MTIRRWVGVLPRAIFCASVACSAHAQPARTPRSHVSSAPKFLNRLEACISLELGQLEKLRNVTVVAAQLTVSQPVAVCGCTSAVIAYRVSTGTGSGRHEAFVGRLNTLPRVQTTQPVYLVLSLDEAIDREWTNPTISMSCSEGG